jgi:hypothetical protein
LRHPPSFNRGVFGFSESVMEIQIDEDDKESDIE